MKLIKKEDLLFIIGFFEMHLAVIDVQGAESEAERAERLVEYREYKNLVDCAQKYIDLDHESIDMVEVAEDSSYLNLYTWALNNIRDVA